MSSLFEKVSFEIDGVEYPINPTMAMIKAVWNEADLVELRRSIISESPHLPNIAAVLSIAIKMNGKKLSADSIFVYFNQGGEAAQLEIFKAIGTLYSSIFPRQEKSKNEKKSDPPKA